MVTCITQANFLTMYCMTPQWNRTDTTALKNITTDNIYRFTSNVKRIIILQGIAIIHLKQDEINSRVRSGVTGIAAMAMATAFVGVLWPLMALRTKYVQLVDVRNSKIMFYVEILDNLSRKPL